MYLGHKGDILQQYHEWPQEKIGSKADRPYPGLNNTSMVTTFQKCLYYIVTHNNYPNFAVFSANKNVRNQNDLKDVDVASGIAGMLCFRSCWICSFGDVALREDVQNC